MAKSAPMSKQQNDRAKDRAVGLIPYKDQPIHKRAMPGDGVKSEPPRDPDAVRRQAPGPAVWHGVGGTPRFGIPLPAASKGPIRSRAARRAKGMPGY